MARWCVNLKILPNIVRYWSSCYPKERFFIVIIPRMNLRQSAKRKKEKKYRLSMFVIIRIQKKVQPPEALSALRSHAMPIPQFLLKMKSAVILKRNCGIGIACDRKADNAS